MNITIAALMPDDLPAAIRLWETTEGVGLSEGDDEGQLARFLDRNPGMSWIAKSGEQVAGAVLCGHDGRRGFLYHLAVQPEFRGRGVGSRLVDACLAALAREGIPKCSIFLYADNEAGKAFWQKHGWSTRTDLQVMQQRPRLETP